MEKDPTNRFSNRVADYVKYRPAYPVQVIDYLIKECGLAKGSTVADVGSGTGIFSALLLQNGFTVYGVEPNEPMRKAAEQSFVGQQNIYLVDGTAEEISLPDAAVDMVVCAQAFHLFRPDETRAKFNVYQKAPATT